MNFLAQKRKQVFLKEAGSNTDKRTLFGNSYYKEVTKIARIGGWSVNIKEKKSFLDPEARRILKTPPSYIPSLKTSLDFYTEGYKEKASQLFLQCSEGIPFSVTMQMQTCDGQAFWAKITGKPVFNEENTVIGVQAAFQDIQEEKIKTLELQKLSNQTKSQNSSLFNFVNLASHNLRSQASNLQLTLELLKTTESKQDEAELTAGLTQISESINETIVQLNEIVAIQSKVNDLQELVSFEDALLQVTSSLQKFISNSNTEIYSDFSEVPTITYIPSYLENILKNLITNAIQYKHPDRNPAIDIYTYVENDVTFLMIKDNGLGMDLSQCNDDLFSLNKNLHHNEGIQGIGLFITKSQVTALQGSIQVESKLHEGTIFKIKFK